MISDVLVINDSEENDVLYLQHGDKSFAELQTLFNVKVVATDTAAGAFVKPNPKPQEILVFIGKPTYVALKDFSSQVRFLTKALIESGVSKEKIYPFIPATMEELRGTIQYHL